MRLLKMGAGLSTRLVKLWGSLWVDSLLANKVQMRFLHMVHASLHFPTWLLQHLLRAELTLERLPSEEGRKQTLDCRKLGPVTIQIGPGGSEDGREEKKARASPSKHVSSRAALPFPVALGMTVATLWWQQCLGSARGAAPLWFCSMACLISPGTDISWGFK